MAVGSTCVGSDIGAMVGETGVGVRLRPFPDTQPARTMSKANNPVRMIVEPFCVARCLISIEFLVILILWRQRRADKDFVSLHYRAKLGKMNILFLNSQFLLSYA
jgi:hypothetical protein